MPAHIYRRVTADEPIEPIVRVIMSGFGAELEKSINWIQNQVTRENCRVATQMLDGVETPVASASAVPMGLFLCGRAVPQRGVLGVATRPEIRGSGIARDIMGAFLREMHGDGYPLSALYSALNPLYRGVGYEHAGVLVDATIPAQLFPAVKNPDDRPNERNPGWATITEADRPAVAACYERYASAQHGMLQRTEYVWQRIREREGDATGYLCRAEDRSVEAYCYLVNKGWVEPPETLGSASGAKMHVTDIAWTTPRGLARLQHFLRGHSSMIGEVSLSIPPSSPLLTNLPDWRYKVSIRTPWMLRVVDVKRALEGRGYLPGISGSIDLEINDDVIEANSGRWTLTVQNGEGRAERATDASSPAVACHVRDLASIYTGYASPIALRDAGRVSCDAPTAALAAGLLAVPGMPAMTDMF